ncbi:MAG TPA: IPExxxVDY family protein [Bacteroidales bacterium]|nr:IPExxxVDY family protein [Bacteroidales bacterium]
MKKNDKKISFLYDLTNEYRIIGICSHLKEYKLCWYTNKVLNSNFSKMDDFSFNGKNDTDEKYSFFYFNDNDNRNNIYLLSNKNNNIPLLEKIPEADYLLIIKGVFSAKRTEELIAGLKKINNILTVFFVDMSKIKEMNSFLTALELHQLSFEEKPKKIRR